MQFGPLWIGTVIGSKALEVSDILYMYKVAADNGYKMDGNKVGPVTVLDESVGTEVESFLSFVPIINLVVQMQRSVATRMQIEEILRTFNEYGAMEEMTKEEKEKYQEKPTGRNAFKISEEAYTRYLLPLYATVNDSIGVLDLNIGKDLDDVIVTRAIGAFEIISEEDIKKIVDLLINNFETKEEFIEAIEESNKIIVKELKEQLKLAKKLHKIANKEGKKFEKEVVKDINQTYKELEEKKNSSSDEKQLMVIDKEKQALIVYKEELKALTKKEKKEHPLEYLNQLDEKKNHLEKIKEEILGDDSLKKTPKPTNKEKKK
ncbi:MAG: hypothetical protein IJ193_01790 [Bacilli bacterium]|nr:hypothetical protein [Bacilli bacterium]